MANIDDLVNNNSFPEWLTVSDKGNKLVDEIKLAKYLEKKYHFTSNQFIEHGYWFDPKSRQWKNYAESVIQKAIRNFYANFLPSCEYTVRRLPELEYYHDKVTDFLVPIQL